MKKRLLASLMAAVMVLTMLPATALASETDPFGYDYDRDGDGVNDSWNVSAEGGENTVYAYLMSNEHTIEATYGKVIDLAPGYTLHVDGTGAMKDYAKNSTAATTDKPIYTSAPWWTTSVLSTETIDADGTAYDGTYLTGITKIVVGSGITRIGSSAFSFMRDVTEVEIANTVTSIGDRAFMYNYSLESIDFPDSVVMNTLAGSNEDKDGELLVGHSPKVKIGMNMIEKVFSEAQEKWSEYLKTVTLGSGFTVIPCRAF